MRKILNTIGVIILTIFFSSLTILCGALGLSSFFYQIKRTWAKTIVFLSGAKIEVHGKKNLRAHKVLFLFNHQSLMDIPFLFVGIERNFNFGAKIELYKIPIFGSALKAAGIFPIDRNNREKAIKSMSIAEKRLTSGENFILAPEGTRQNKVGLLSSFKSGPFILAINSKATIIPVVLSGVEKVLKNKDHLLKHNPKNTVFIDILDPIQAEQYNLNTKEKLKEHVYKVMHSAIEKRITS